MDKRPTSVWPWVDHVDSESINSKVNGPYGICESGVRAVCFSQPQTHE